MQDLLNAWNSCLWFILSIEFSLYTKISERNVWHYLLKVFKFHQQWIGPSGKGLGPRRHMVGVQFLTHTYDKYLVERKEPTLYTLHISRHKLIFAKQPWKLHINIITTNKNVLISYHSCQLL